MPGYTIPLQAPLLVTQYGRTIRRTVRTSAAQTQSQQPPGDNSRGFERLPGGEGSNQAPPYPDPDPDPDPEKKKRNKAIDAKRKGQFLIDSESLLDAKGRLRDNMKCEVERYELGTDLTIEDWINQIETYFTVGQVSPEAFVGFMLMKIVPKHLNKIKEYQNLDYLAF